MEPSQNCFCTILREESTLSNMYGNPHQPHDRLLVLAAIIRDKKNGKENKLEDMFRNFPWIAWNKLQVFASSGTTSYFEENKMLFIVCRMSSHICWKQSLK